MIIFANLVPKPFAGIAIGPIAIVKPEFREDVGLIAHEKKHIEQFWRNPFKIILSPFVGGWRLELEVEAYKEQLKYSPHAARRFAGFLATRYRLDITEDEALAELTK